MKVILKNLCVSKVVTCGKGERNVHLFIQILYSIYGPLSLLMGFLLRRAFALEEKI